MLSSPSFQIGSTVGDVDEFPFRVFLPLSSGFLTSASASFVFHAAFGRVFFLLDLLSRREYERLSKLRLCPPVLLSCFSLPPLGRFFFSGCGNREPPFIPKAAFDGFCDRRQRFSSRRLGGFCDGDVSVLLSPDRLRAVFTDGDVGVLSLSRPRRFLLTATSAFFFFFRSLLLVSHWRLCQRGFVFSFSCFLLPSFLLFLFSRSFHSSLWLLRSPLLSLLLSLFFFVCCRHLGGFLLAATASAFLQCFIIPPNFFP